MKSRHWWQALAVAGIAAGVFFSLQGHEPDTSKPRGPSRRPAVADAAGTTSGTGETAAAVDPTPDPVPPPHEVSAAPPFGFVPPPDNNPLPSGGETEERRQQVDPAARNP